METKQCAPTPTSQYYWSDIFPNPLVSLMHASGTFCGGLGSGEVFATSIGAAGRDGGMVQLQAGSMHSLGRPSKVTWS